MGARSARWAAQATAQLHAWKCCGRSWSEECRRPDGGRHARETMRPLVREALAGSDPIAYLHDRLCDAEIDRAVRGCPDRTRHIAHMTMALGSPVLGDVG